MQRAENVTLIYCSHADDKTTGEASRYIYQLDYESPFSLKYTDVGVDVNLSDSNSIVIPKEGEVDRILEQYSRQEDRLPISPSAINRYVACPLRFYFQHIARIKASDELSEDVDNSMFGNILHHSMQNLYEPLTGRTPEQTRADIERLRSSRDKVEEVVVAAVREVCHLKPNLEVSKFAADLLLIKDIIVKYIIDGVMKYDTSSALFSIVEVEQKHRYTLPLEGGKSIDIEGIIDRVDRLEGGAYRVIDYKSGGKHLEFKSVGDLFEGAGRDRQGHIIQTLTYSMMLSHLSKSEVVPSLYYVRFMHEQNHSPLLIDKSGAEGEKIITTYRAKAESFENHLVAALSTLLDRQIPFEQAKDKEGTCSFCDFRAICRV